MIKRPNIIDEAYEILGYRFRNEDLLKESLTHASIAGHRLESNERMEFLGDAILNFTVCEYLFRHYPEMHEGDMTKIKSAVVSRKICAKMSEAINLSSMLSLGKGIASRATLPGSIAAAVFESIVAAIYLDGGIRPAKSFIVKHVKPFIIESAESAHQQNFKSVLQQYAQKNLPHIPNYVYLDEKGPDHSKCFEVCVEIEDRHFESAWANSKKEAEQTAALRALCGLGLAKVDKDGHVHLLNLLAPKTSKRTPKRASKRAAKPKKKIALFDTFPPLQGRAGGGLDDLISRPSPLKGRGVRRHLVHGVEYHSSRTRQQGGKPSNTNHRK